MKRVIIQGEAGCFHEAAAKQFFKEDIEIIPCETFPLLFDSIKKDKSLMAIVAIENTIAGSILQNHELLRTSNQKIIGECKMHISHTICALPGTDLSEIKEVHSHPMALMQCEEYLKKHPWIKMVEADDTAGSAYIISKNRIEGHAAICGEYAANLYGLNILEHDIQTNKRNFTRFLILAANDSAECAEQEKIDKASIVFTLPHTHGSLSKVLTIFSFYDINLSKIQSLPIIGKEWEYRFYVNLTFDDYDRYRQSIEAVRPLINDFKILGEYEHCDTPA